MKCSMWNREGNELPQSKPDGFASSLGEGASGAPGSLALQPETLPPCQRPHPRGGCLRSRLGEFRQIPPQALRASSPKGTPLRYAGNFIATAKSRPLGEGGIAVGDDGRGNLRSGALCTSARNFPAMPKAPSPRGLSAQQTGGVSADTPSGATRQLPQGDAFALCRKPYRHRQKPSPWGRWLRPTGADERGNFHFPTPKS